jgi:hypothetical protein
VRLFLSRSQPFTFFPCIFCYYFSALVRAAREFFPGRLRPPHLSVSHSVGKGQCHIASSCLDTHARHAPVKTLICSLLFCFENLRLNTQKPNCNFYFIFFVPRVQCDKEQHTHIKTMPQRHTLFLLLPNL